MWYCRIKLSEEEKERMDRSYGLSDKGTIHVINFLKQRITTAGAKIRRYNQRNQQYHQNNMFRYDQRQFYKELDGKMDRQSEAPDPKGSAEFWSKLWSEPVARSMDWKTQTGGMSIHLLLWRWWSRIVLGSYYPDRHDSGTQQARYYAGWKDNTEMDNHWYCCSRWLQYSQNRGLESGEIPGSSIWGKENPSCRDSHSTSCDWSSSYSTKATHQVNWAFRHWWHHSQHPNDSIVRNSRNTMQGYESLSYKS